MNRMVRVAAGSAVWMVVLSCGSGRAGLDAPVPVAGAYPPGGAGGGAAGAPRDSGVEAAGGGGGGDVGAGGGGGGRVPGPSGDACPSAIPLDLSKGAATVFASVEALHNDQSGTCGGATSMDAVYSFTLPQPARVVARGGNLVYLRRDCEGAEVACGSSVDEVLAAGTYFLWVEASVLAQTYELTVVTSMGDNCSQPFDLPVTNGVASAGGFASFTPQDFSSQCGSSMLEGDVVYRFTTTQPRRLVAEAPNGQFLSLRSACLLPTTELACDDGTPQADDTAGFAVAQLNPGTYFLIARPRESFVNATHQYGFGVRLSEPAPNGGAEGCSAMTALTVPRGTSVAVAGKVGTQKDWAGTYPCDLPGADTVHQVVVPATGKLTLKVFTQRFGAMLGLAIAGPTPTCSGANPVGCGLKPAARAVSLPNLLAGTYWVWVTGAPGSEYLLEATLE